MTCISQTFKKMAAEMNDLNVFMSCLKVRDFAFRKANLEYIKPNVSLLSFFFNHSLQNDIVYYSYLLKIVFFFQDSLKINDFTIKEYNIPKLAKFNNIESVTF